MTQVNTESVLAVDERPETSLSRRTFVAVAAGAVGCLYAGAIGYPVYKYLDAPVVQAKIDAKANSMELKGADKLAPGSVLMFLFNATPAMLIHFADGTWIALSAVCTHLGCTLDYQPPAPKILCACHGGEYDPKTGANTGGPPPKPLTRYAIEVTVGKITVSRAA